MFNYLEHLKKIIRINIYFLKDIILKACNKASTKLAKYYSKTKKLNDTLYNFVDILDLTQKISLYKLKIKKKTTILLITKTNIRQNLRIIIDVITI